MPLPASLDQVPIGQSCSIRPNPHMHDRVVRRLAVMGLPPGTMVQVIAHATSGARILGIGASRLAIDSQVARQLEVDLVGGGPA
ncbi:MAG: FeoA family protein [Candidatus Nanopelagicales bacterium]|nr:FeoA family protein [Candidatus Nanopelagicales bacterium]